MAHKCYISFKTENIDYKNQIQNSSNIEIIDKSLNEPIVSDDEDYIMRKIREDYLSDSTVTIFLIGRYSFENLGWSEQKYIKRELQASFYDEKNNTKNGVLGIVLPEMVSNIYKGTIHCNQCNNTHNHVAIDDNTVISEFSYNYYIPNDKCSHSESDRYCVLVKWNDFCDEPNKYIDKAFSKRSDPIADKVKVYID